MNFWLKDGTTKNKPIDFGQMQLRLLLTLELQVPNKYSVIMNDLKGKFMKKNF